MATWEAYWTGGVAYCVWMACFAILDLLWVHTRPFILDLGGDLFKQEVQYIDTILGNWVLIGAAGIFLAVFAAGLTAGRGGIPR